MRLKQRYLFRESGESKDVKLNFDPISLFVAPIVSLFKTFSKKRPKGRRNLVLMQFLIYGSYRMISEENHLEYVYLKHQFSGFTGSDYSYITNYKNFLSVLGLLVLTPLFTKRFGIHESLLSSIALAMACLGYLLAAFSKNIWQFYIAKVTFKCIPSKSNSNSFLDMHDNVFLHLCSCSIRFGQMH